MDKELLGPYFMGPLKDNEVSVYVFLTNGLKLAGIITDFSDDGLLLRRDGVEQMVYRHAIATILPVNHKPAYGAYNPDLVM